MDAQRKGQIMKKVKAFASMAGKLNILSSNAQQKKQEENEAQNLMNLEIEKGIAQEKFLNAVQRKNKTESDAKLILQNICDYEAINKLFGKDTEINAKVMTYQKGQPIIKQNEPSNNKFYVIAKGSVVIVKANDTNVFQVVQKEDDKNQYNTVIPPKTSMPSLTTIEKEAKRQSIINLKKEKEQQDILKTEIQKYGKEINTLRLGQGFGEAAIVESDPKKAKRGATILACEENTQLIIILKRDFQKFKDTFSSQGKEKALILAKLIPQLKMINSTQTRDDLIFYFQEEGGLRGQTLTIEDKQGDKIYILKEGSVQIEKNYVNEKNIYYRDIQKIKIASVSDNSFLGEEILLSNEENSKYNYTITISSIQARYYSIKKMILMNKFPNLIKDILNEYELKVEHRKNTVDYILSKNQQPSNMISVGDTLHEYNKLKNYDLFSQMKASMVEIHNKNVFKDVVKTEKMQTSEDIAKIRQGIVREFEENPKQKLTSQTDILIKEERNNQQLLNVKRPATTQMRIQSQVKTEFLQENMNSNAIQVEDKKNAVNHNHKNQHGTTTSVKIKPSSSQNSNIFNNENENKINVLKLNQTNSDNFNPVYCSAYRSSYNSEDNFMENLSEKLKLMSKVQQNPKDSPQLDLGYLESFKKKQQLKLLVKQKAINRTNEFSENRMNVMQKKIDQIKSKYLKGNKEQEIIIQDGFSVQNTNSNSLFNSQLAKTVSENTPKSTSLLHDSSSTPLSQKGLKGIRKSNQAIKLSNFNTEGKYENKNMKFNNFIVKSSSDINFTTQQYHTPQNNSNYQNNPTFTSSIPSLYAINSERDYTKNKTISTINMNTPQNIQRYSNNNIVLPQENINQKTQNKHHEIQNSENKSCDHKQINSSGSLQNNIDSNKCNAPTSSPFKQKQSIKNLEIEQNFNKFDNINLTKALFGYQNSSCHNPIYQTKNLQSISSQDFNFDKNGISVQTNFSSFAQKDLQIPYTNITNSESKLGTNYFLDQKHSSTSVQLQRKSLQRQKLKTGLSFQIKNQIA